MHAMLPEDFPFWSDYFNLLHLMFSASVAAVKMSPRTTSMCSYIILVLSVNGLYVVYRAPDNYFF